MKRTVSLLLIAILLFSLGSGAIASADEPGGSPVIEKPINVTITDELGAAVAGVTVQVLNESGEVVDSFVSSGGADSIFLPEGKYTLKVTAVPEGYLLEEVETSISVELLEAERLDNLAGICYFDHEHPEVCSNPNHVGLETYAVFDGSGSVTAYCFNQNYDEPDGTNCYRRLVGTPELLYELAQNKNGSVGPQALYDHVLSMIYHSSYIQSKYGFDDTLTRYLVNMAIKNFTDPAVFYTFDDNGESTLARDENGKPIRDENGNYVFNPGGTVLGSLIHHAYACNGNQDTFPQAYRDAYHELISLTYHPSDYYLYIYYPNNFQPGNTNTYQCLMSVFTVEPIRTSLSIRSATQIEITKKWADGNDQDGLRPDVRTFTAGLHLLADDADVTETYRDKLTVTENDDGTYTAKVEQLPKLNDSLEEIQYLLREDAVPGYTADKDSAADGETITNTHAPEPTQIPISKSWDDDGDRDGKRPDNITVHLLADDVEVQSAELNEEGNWVHTFTELPKFRDHGVEIVYTVTEDPVDGYETVQEGYNFTNKYTPETIEIPVTKTWDDANDQDGKRPKSITIRLLADGTEVQSATVTPDDQGNWSYTFKDLPKFRDHATEIVYTVKEDPITGYESTVEGFKITNKHVPEVLELPVVKSWSDSNNKAGKRPASITVRLLADGKEIQVITIRADAQGNWGYTFKDLPKYAAGKAIQYTIKEDPVSGYYTSITPNKEGFLIRNSTSPITGDLSHPGLWLGLLGASALGLGAVLILLRKRRNA